METYKDLKENLSENPMEICRSPTQTGSDPKENCNSLMETFICLMKPCWNPMKTCEKYNRNPQEIAQDILESNNNM